VSRINLYLVRTILSVTGIVALALIAIFTFTTFVSDIDKVGKGEFGLRALMVYTLLNLPFGLQTLLPIIAMLGALMGLGTLASQSEITALRAAGISELRIGVAALMAGCVMGIIGWVNGDWIAPQGRQAADRLKTEARYGRDAGATLKPVWLRDGPYLIHIARLVSETKIQDTTLYTLGDDLKLREVVNVVQGEYQGDHWQFAGVRRTRFDGGKTEADTLERMDWSGGLSPEVLRLFVLEARSLTTPGLLGLIRYLDDNGLDSTAQRFALWRKLVSPLTIMVLTFVAVPFATQHSRRGGSGLRLMVGVLLGLGFFVLDQVTSSMGLLYGWHPAVAASLPTASLGALAWWKLARSG
jgi:lipopolysaccharide export system permease protein